MLTTSACSMDVSSTQLPNTVMDEDLNIFDTKGFLTIKNIVTEEDFKSLVKRKDKRKRLELEPQAVTESAVSVAFKDAVRLNKDKSSYPVITQTNR